MKPDTFLIKTQEPFIKITAKILALAMKPDTRNQLYDPLLK